jgi:hypothetical protein
VTTPNSVLQLCVLHGPAFQPEQGGPAADAPSFDCSRNASASRSGTDTAYKFDVTSLVSDGELAIAILPTSPADRVVLDQPGVQSLAVQTSSVGAGSGGSTPAATGPAIGASGTTPAVTGSPAGSDVTGAPGGSSVVGAPASGTAPGVAGTASDTPSPAPSLSQTLDGAATANPSPGGAERTSTQPTGATAVTGPTQQLTAASSSGGEVSPLGLGVLLAAVVIGAILWTAAGRSAVHRDDEQWLDQAR